MFAHPRELRRAIRSRAFNGQTAGQCRGYTQGNLAILPAAYAADFKRFCELNPKPCPIIGISAPGSPHIVALGTDLDIRTDISQYCVWENGEYKGDVPDLNTLWSDDWVAFVIGCSFSFEEALMMRSISDSGFWVG